LRKEIPKNKVKNLFFPIFDVFFDLYFWNIRYK
jgi:hypothetical protein